VEKDSIAPPTMPPNLRADLDRSQEDLAAGRLHDLTPVLTAIHQRASARHERRRQKLAQSESQRLAEQL
jgi:hypothetical protein